MQIGLFGDEMSYKKERRGQITFKSGAIINGSMTIEYPHLEYTQELLATTHTVWEMTTHDGESKSGELKGLVNVIVSKEEQLIEGILLNKLWGIGMKIQNWKDEE